MLVVAGIIHDFGAGIATQGSGGPGHNYLRLRSLGHGGGGQIHGAGIDFDFDSGLLGGVDGVFLHHDQGIRLDRVIGAVSKDDLGNAL